MNATAKKTVKKAPVRKAVVKAKPQELAPAPAGQSISPIQQLQQMKSMGLEVADMREMLALQKEYEAHEALKIYNSDMALFKAEEIKLTKDKKVNYENKDGSITAYAHPSLANAVETAVPYMSAHGFSHKWTLEQLDGGMVRVTCVITHRNGHSESTSLQSSRDDSGGKNNIQGIGSTVTYLERYTFLALAGLAAADQDNDGQTAEPLVEAISTDQVLEIEDLIKETGSDRAKFLAACQVVDLETMPLTRYPHAKKALMDKARMAP